jgi:predicted transposase YdaD
MFDPLLEEDPWVQEFGARKEAEGEAKGEARGEAKGELKSSRDIFINIVKTRFPALATSAEVRALQIDKPEELTLLLQRIVLAPDEQTARALLAGGSTLSLN